MSKIFVGIALAVATLGAGFSASPGRIRRSRVQKFALTSFMSSMSVIPRALTTLITRWTIRQLKRRLLRGTNRN